MTKRLETQFRDALALAVTTLGDVAGGVGRTYRMVQAYNRGERRVTPGAGRALADYLKTRAVLLHRAAEKLEAAAEREEGR